MNKITKFKRLLVIALAISMVVSLSSCNNGDEVPEETTPIQSATDTTKPPIVEFPTGGEISESIYVGPSAFKEALSGHMYLHNSFDFETSHNLAVEVSGNDETQYVSRDTYIFTGRMKEIPAGITGKNATYSASIEYRENNEFPTTISIETYAENNVDFTNLQQWSYQMLGSFLPVSLATKIQNAESGKISNNIYTEDGVRVDVYKDLRKNNGGTFGGTISIVMSKGEDIYKFGDVDQMVIGVDSKVPFYELPGIKGCGTIHGLNSRVKGLYSGEEIKVKLNEFLIQEHLGFKDTIYTSYSKHSVSIDDMVNLELVISTNHTIKDDIDEESLNLSSRTARVETQELAYQEVEKFIKTILAIDVDLSDYYNSDSATADITSDMFGMPAKLNVKINKGANGCIAAFDIKTVK